ncbi:hypothetical protein KIN20_022532 [Parelaphostrongylus tenuis]|uniref:Uncharacterized protein n=1 Tax=Parelaphostrongylus tenuis TaxID=148309 RepID=A0AAD5N937_PARTN|nr:hypothetical protein KIN20_022532 [Parelaphostrongylus tenuis]
MDEKNTKSIGQSSKRSGKSFSCTGSEISKYKPKQANIIAVVIYYDTHESVESEVLQRPEEVIIKRKVRTVRRLIQQVPARLSQVPLCQLNDM